MLISVSRLHTNNQHVDSVTLMREVEALLLPAGGDEVALKRAILSSEYLRRFKKTEMDVLLCITGYLGSRLICTLFDLAEFVSRTMNVESFDKLAVRTIIFSSPAHHRRVPLVSAQIGPLHKHPEVRHHFRVPDDMQIVTQVSHCPFGAGI